MNPVYDLLDALDTRGIELWIERDKLRFRAPSGALTPDLREQVAALREDVMAALAERELPVSEPEHANEQFPLTDVQTAYLVGRTDAYQDGRTGCHGYAEFNIPEELIGAPEDLQAAWRKVVDCHDMLRVQLSPDGWQRIDPDLDVPLQVRECTTAAEFDRTRDDVRSRLRQFSYTFGAGPLIDAVVTLGPSQALLHLSVDLILTDFQGIEILLHDFERALAGPDAELTKPATSFRDYVLTRVRRNRTARAQAAHEQDERHWAERSESLPSTMQFPSPRRRPDHDDGIRYTRRSHIVPEFHWRRITDRAQHDGITASAVLLAVLGRVARRYTDANRSLITATVLNRDSTFPGAQRLVGDFTDTMLVEAPGDSSVPFVELAHTAQASMFDAMDHSSIGGIEVNRLIARQNGWQSFTPPVVLTSTVGADGHEHRRLHPIVSAGLSQTPQVHLDVQAAAHRGGASLVWDSRDGSIDEDVLTAAFADFVTAIERLATDASAWHEDVLDRRQVPEIERQSSPTTGGMHARILAHADADPHAPAVIDSTGTVTRGELAARARRVARTIEDAQVPPGTPVIVALPPGADQIAAEIGVLIAGSHFVPIDPEWPVARRNHIVAALGGDRWVFVIDESTPIADEQSHGRFTDPDGLAYVIFTSGSTGSPKGVAITHAQVATTLNDIEARLVLTDDDAVLAISRHSFDLAVFNVFGVLGAGGRVIVPASGTTADPEAWAQAITAHGVSIWNSVPEQLQLLLEYLDDSSAAADQLASLRAILVSGDWVPVRQPEHLWRYSPQARFLALGGATEASIWSNVHEVTEPLPTDARSVPYGRPLSNQGMWVLNSDLEPTVTGQIGEIHIGGDAVADGYIGVESAAFYTHPDTDERCYRTGDLGRLDENGDIEFLGRSDGQIKIRGHRVELGEIEAVLAATDGVAAAVAAALDSGPSRTIAAAVVPRRGPAERAAGDADASQVERAVHDAHHAFLDSIDPGAFSELLTRMHAVALDAMGAAIADRCGTVPANADAVVAAVAAPQHRALVRRWLRALNDHGRAEVASGTMTRGPESVDTATLINRWQEVRREANRLAYGDDQLAYVERCIAELSGLLDGTVDPLGLLFPEGDTSVAFSAYGGNLTAAYLNRLVSAGVRERAGQHAAAGRPVRILEIGAGVGGTTAAVLDALADVPVEYTFTDVSHFFLTEAAQRWPSLIFRLFDINEDIEDQGLTPGSFDIIVSANVLHNARNIPDALERLHRLLAPGGMLAAIDATMVNPALQISMEFKEGLNDFTDLRAERGDAFFMLPDWVDALDHSTFDRFTHLPGVDDPISTIAQSVFFAFARLDEAVVSAEDALSAAAEQLPKYMVPSEAVTLPSLPLTANGKVDRAAITTLLEGIPRTARPSRVASCAAEPLDPRHEAIAAIWRDVLGLAPNHPIGVDDSFFDLGGDSLLIARCVGRLRRDIDGGDKQPWDHVLRHVVADPTLSGCARAVSTPSNDHGGGSADAPSPLVPVLEPRGHRWLGHTVVFVHDGSGGLSPYDDLVEHLADKDERPRILGLQRTPDDGYFTTAPEDLFDSLADRYVEHLDGHTDGSVHLVGYCMGGLIAASIAERLSDRDIPTSLTVISSYRIPFTIEDPLLLDYSFARLMLRDPADAGLAFDEHELGALLTQSRALHDDRVPNGAVADLATRFPTLGEAVRAAPTDTSARLARLADSDPDRHWTVDALLSLRESYVASLRAVAAFDHPGYIGDITFLRQRGDLHFLPTLQDDMTSFWSEYCLGDLDVIDVDGTHFDCLLGESADHVVDVLEYVWEGLR